MNGPRHFLDLDRIDGTELRRILDSARAMKNGGTPRGATPLAGRGLALVFEKPSTRTRVSFEVAMRQLGGDVVVLQGDSSQLGRGETIADTARVLSRYVDAIMIRTGRHENLVELAEYASVPVINGLTDTSHPCQIMADILTVEEHRGAIAGKVLAWVGDGNNVANSFIHAAAPFGYELRLACPPGFEPDGEVVARARTVSARVEITDDPVAAVAGADCVITDTWVSMGDTDADRRRAALAPYQVNEALMAHADADAVFLHCLPAHRGEEVTDQVIDGRWSVVWDEAENRLHAQKAILCWTLLRDGE